jgi:hypothetical protein
MAVEELVLKSGQGTGKEPPNIGLAATIRTRHATNVTRIGPVLMDFDSTERE